MKRRILASVLAAMVIVSALPYTVLAAKVTKPKPVLRYTFDGNKPLNDENGKNALKLEGGAEITDEGNTGGALLLNGTDGYALLPQDILSDSMTVTAWVRIDKFTVWGRVFDFGTDANSNFFFAPYSGGAARVEMKTPKSVDTMDTDQETEKNWVHYAVTVDKDTVSYYRNGRLIKSKSNLSIKPSDIKNTLNYIGKSHYDGDAYLAAAIDDFRVYDTALSRENIRDIMADGEIDAEILLKSYSIADGQIITGDRIELPEFDGIEWSETDTLSLIDTGEGAVKHGDKTEQVTLKASFGGEAKEYTVYVTGKNESPYTIDIDAADRSKDVSDTMWGLFFEDINSAADGGLYAELVQNRSFEIENDGHLYSWETDGIVNVKTDFPLNENNPTYITIDPGASVTNDGFAGMSIKNGEVYEFSMYIRSDGAVYPKPELTDESGISIGAELSYAVSEEALDGEWKRVSGMIAATADTGKARLVLKNISDEKIDADMISLIPKDTYKGHGLRKDLMEALEAMHPKFLRFPGGCAVEGLTMEEAWNWKDTIGDVSSRKEMINIWNPSATEPYMMTYGLGFYEYFRMCEDLNMEPVPILNCGMACQVRSGSAKDEAHLVPMDKLQPYIDDALDLIEFANGTDPENEWVKKRIEMGHPEPFNMKYIGIGNEQYGDIYFERYAEFAKQIHEKYPDLNLVTTSGTASGGAANDLAWTWANENDELADRMDEHYYESADWFRQHAYRYDDYRRDTNTKVFLGEYASKGNTWYNALSEAAFMTGLERNSDVVRMASYAPMFAKYGNVQWSAANMIWFNNDKYVLTPNYYVQTLFSNNQGDYSLPASVSMKGINNDASSAKPKTYGPVYASAVYDEETDEVIVKVVNTIESAVSIDLNITGADIGEHARTFIMAGDTALENTLDNPDAIAPYTSEITNAGNNFTYNAPANSLSIIRLPAENVENRQKTYISGYEDGTFRPDNIITRAEAAAMIAKLSDDYDENKIYFVRGSFSDLENGALTPWYSRYIRYVAEKGYDTGYDDRTFRAENPITRGEFAAMLARFINLAGTGQARFADVPGDYFASGYIEKLLNKGIVSGYEDGTFRPEGTLTRGEAVTMINKATGRRALDGSGENPFADVSPEHWAYDEILKAVN